MSQNVDPTREQFDRFKSLPRDTPIMMLNLSPLSRSTRMLARSWPW